MYQRLFSKRNFREWSLCVQICWRKVLADTINVTNEQLGIAVYWEHCSFKKQGIEQEPTIHIGAVANALARKGIKAVYRSTPN